MWRALSGQTWTKQLIRTITIMTSSLSSKPNPAVFSFSVPCIRFDTMTKGSNKVRRIDAALSLLEPGFSFATEWLWYWEDEFGKWNTYASPVSNWSRSNPPVSKLSYQWLYRHELPLISSWMVRLKFSAVVMSVSSHVAGRWTQTSRRGQLFSGAEVSGWCQRCCHIQSPFTDIFPQFQG